MNAIDTDEILRATSKYASQVIQEYMQVPNFSERDEKAQELIKQMVRYLSDDRAPIAIKQCALEYYTSVITGYGRRLLTTKDATEYKTIGDTINNMHRELISYCITYEKMFQNAEQLLLPQKSSSRKVSV